MSLLPILSKVRDLNSFSTCAIISGVTFTPLFTGDISSFIADSEEDDDDELFFDLGVVAATFFGEVGGVVFSAVDAAFFFGPADDGAFELDSSLFDASSSISSSSDIATAVDVDFASAVLLFDFSFPASSFSFDDDTFPSDGGLVLLDVNGS